MQAYGFPWPNMLDCEKFPEDNDMCITAQSNKAPKEDNGCSGKPCDQPVTAENILDNFCRADFVVKVRIRKVKPRKLVGKKARVYRAWKGTKEEMKKLRNPKIGLTDQEKCCADRAKEHEGDKFLVMGKKPRTGGDLVPTFIIPWTKSKEIRRARRMFKKMDCSNLKETSQKMIQDAFAPRSIVEGSDSRKRRGSRSKRRRQRKRQDSLWAGMGVARH